MKITFKNTIHIAIIIVGIDQLTKFWAFTHIRTGEPLILIPSIIQARFVKNTGAAFSLLKDSTIFLSIISISISIYLLIWLWRNKPFTSSQALGMSFLLGGTIGNGIDRIRVGFVTDFIELIPINFPIFNFADISINIALFFLILDYLKKLKHHNDINPKL